MWKLHDNKGVPAYLVCASSQPTEGNIPGTVRKEFGTSGAPSTLNSVRRNNINQKAFGAYYTRPEITGYLAERSIHQLILERVHEPAMPELKLPEIKYDTVADMLARMDARTALKLVNVVLPSITVLDSAVGSGAFLVAALKCLINV